MPILRERVETTLPIDEAFAFVADFANNERWDPGTATAEAIDAGPPRVGTRYRLGVRMAGRVAPMEYRIIGFEPPRRVVLQGEGSGVKAVDDIRFTEAPPGTLIDYTADIRLTGFLRFLQPFLGRAFRSIGRNAAAGMRDTLAELAAERSTASAGQAEQA
jgi:carbon monoxide dehydrogenase subunit G